MIVYKTKTEKPKKNFQIVKMRGQDIVRLFTSRWHLSISMNGYANQILLNLLSCYI